MKKKDKTKQKIDKEIERNKNKEKKQKPIFKTPSYSTQMVTPIRDIYKGTVITTDGRYLRILEIKASDFAMRTGSEKENIISAFEDVLKVLPSTAQILAVSLRSDLTSTIRYTKERMENETVECCIEMGEQYLEQLKQEQTDGSTRRFFIVYQYENVNFGPFAKTPIDVICEQLDIIARRVETAIAGCKNDLIVKYPSDLSANSAEILYTMFNKEKYGLVSFDSHFQDVYNRYFGAYGQREFYVPPTDYIAPDELHFRGTRYVACNNLYYGYAYVSKNGYPQYLFAGWATRVFAKKDVDISIHIQKVPKDEVIGKIRRNVSRSQENLMEVGETSEASESAQKKLEAGNYLRTGLTNGEEYCYLSVMLTVTGSSPEEVKSKMEELKNIGKLNDFNLVEVVNETEDAFFSCLPLNTIGHNLWEKSKRNFLLCDASSVYPFTSFEINDEEGVYIGNLLNNDSMCILDFANKRFTNSNTCILGTAGSGKTFTELALATRMRIQRIPCYIITPEKEHEYFRLCSAMGGEFIRLGADQKTNINIMEIYPVDKRAIQSSMDLGLNIGTTSQLTEKVRSLKTFFKLLIPGMNQVMIAKLDSYIVKTYERFGITEDEESLWKDEEHTRYKDMPILSDLRKEMEEDPEMRPVYTIMGMFETGSGKCFNKRTNVDLSNPFTVFSVQHLEEEFVSCGIYIVMDYVWSKVKENIDLRKAIFIDEFWKLSTAASQIIEIAKIIRGYGGQLVLATQQLADIMKLPNGLGESVIGNSSFKILMKMSKNDADLVGTIVGLTNSEYNRIQTFRNKGEALLLGDDMRVEIAVRSSQMEYELFTTNRSDYADMMREKNEKKRLELERKKREEEEESRRKEEAEQMRKLLTDEYLDVIDITDEKKKEEEDKQKRLGNDTGAFSSENTAEYDDDFY